MKHVHLGLHADVANELEAVAIEKHSTKSDIIRAALGEYLARWRRQRKHESMRRYAEELAGQSAEFTEQSDDAVVSRLLAETEW